MSSLLDIEHEKRRLSLIPATHCIDDLPSIGNGSIEQEIKLAAKMKPDIMDRLLVIDACELPAWLDLTKQYSIPLLILMIHHPFACKLTVYLRDGCELCLAAYIYRVGVYKVTDRSTGEAV